MIKKSVGFGGDNDPLDICTIQYLLNCVPVVNGGPSEELPVDGARHGAGFTKLVDAIRRFQARIFQGWSDGRVDPGGQTLMHLRRWNPADPSYGAYVKQGATGIKGEDQSLKTIKGSGSSAQKGMAAASDAALKAVQSSVKFGGSPDKHYPHKDWTTGSKDAGFVKYSPGGMKEAGAQKVHGGIKGEWVLVKGSGASGGMTKGFEGIKGYKGGLPASSGDEAGTLKGMPSQKGAAGFPGSGVKGESIKGGFTDPFNMKGGGGGVGPGTGHIKGGMVDIN